MQKCGSCTACCYAFPVIELNKSKWEVCEYMDNNCKIYKKRPESCRKCMCAWMQMKEVGKELRPDKCGVIFERDNNTMVGTIVGNITTLAKHQINYFRKEGFHVILNGENV
jgi:hypothetical protein